MEKVYIRDCNGNTVGNPKGYKSIESATKQVNTRGSKVYNQIWDAFYKKGDLNQGGLIWTASNGSKW